MTNHRNLAVCSGFLSTRLPGTDRAADMADPADHERLVDLVTAYAEFLRDCGASIIWPGWMRLLRALRHEGWAVFELDTAADPVGGLRKIKAYVEGALLPIYR